jgi:hypothetical protein
MVCECGRVGDVGHECDRAHEPDRRQYASVRNRSGRSGVRYSPVSVI